LRQIERWLNAEFPPPRPTVVVMHRFNRSKLNDDGEFADTTRIGRRIRIRLDSRLTWFLAIHFLLHEWAHAVSWPLAKAEEDMNEHSVVEFGGTYAAILHRFHADEGWLRSQDYACD
jgi:hypothetical protein